MTPLFLILATLPSLLATPCPCSDIYSYVHSSCYNTAPKPCTMNLGGGKSKSLLTVEVQKRGRFVSTCHKPNGINICFYPITHWEYSDGGGVLDQNRGKKTRTSYKEHNFPVTGDPWALPMPRPSFPIMTSPKTSLWQPTPYLPSQLFLPILPVHTTHIPVLDMHVTVSLTTHSNSLTLNLAVTGQLYLPFPTKNYTTHWANLWQCPTLSLFKPNLY